MCIKNTSNTDLDQINYIKQRTTFKRKDHKNFHKINLRLQN
jgi:hypothetical protein